jgi:hypothetical protein
MSAIPIGNSMLNLNRTKLRSLKKVNLKLVKVMLIAFMHVVTCKNFGKKLY